MNKIKAFIPNLLTLGNLLCGVLAIIVFVSSCTNHQNEVVEEKIFECFNNYFHEQGIDLETELRNYELEIIKEGVLEDSSGKSYLKLYNSVIEESTQKFSSEYYNPNLINYHNEMTLSCVTDVYDIYSNKKSLTYIQLAERLQSEINTQEHKPEKLAEIYQIVVGEKGFERKLYKAYALLSLNSMSYDITKDPDYITCELEVFNNGKVLLNGETIKINEISQKVLEITKDIPKENRFKFLVNLKADGDVPFRYIDEIKTQLRMADALQLNYEEKHSQ